MCEHSQKKKKKKSSERSVSQWQLYKHKNNLNCGALPPAPFCFSPLELSSFFCISGFLHSTFLSSKGRSITTLGTRWHDFFITFLNILYFCFILLIAFLFLFLRDADSRKGTLCPFCVPIHKKSGSLPPTPPCLLISPF